MAARPGPAAGSRERRPAVWPWLVMPAIVLVVFYALYRMHQQPPVRGPEVAQPVPAASGPGAAQP